MQAKPRRTDMTKGDALTAGRAAFDAHAWEQAHTQLSRVEAPSAEDLARLAAAAYMLGRDQECTDAWTRAHQAFVDQGETERAVRCAFWLAFCMLNTGDQAQGFGWMARAARLLEDVEGDCVERGYLVFPKALSAIFAGDNEAARDGFREAAEIGKHFGDRDLVTMARHGEGRALIRMGEVDAGIGLLDEVMIAVTTGEVSPIVAGDVYCSVIEACHEVYDLKRAHEWTGALRHWCDGQPDLVPYRGSCLVRRAEILQLHGEWPEALDEAEKARERLSHPRQQPAVGAAFYQLGELHRLCGAFDKAEDAYRDASQYGRKPQPGLALLRLARGQTDSARAAITHALDGATAVHARSSLLGANVEILLAADDVPGARTAADELADIAGRLNAPFLQAISDRTTGAVLLAERDPRASLTALRTAADALLQLNAPYDHARAREMTGAAFAALGDHESSQMELDAALRAYRELGARADIDRLEHAAGREIAETPGGLTARERDVIGLVATGKTNREIAEALEIAEKTVARHLSNIFTKLGLSSRAAATAWAYEHDLV